LIAGVKVDEAKTILVCDSVLISWKHNLISWREKGLLTSSASNCQV